MGKVESFLEEFGRKGLRTLMFAEREISEEEYKEWSKDYFKAFTSNTDKKKKLDNCYEKLERNMCLIGATAIEDCLQENLSNNINILIIKIRTYFRSF